MARSCMFVRFPGSRMLDQRRWFRWRQSWLPLTAHWEYAVPINFHVHHRPAFGPGFIKALVEPANGGLPVVGPLTLSISMMDVKAIARTGRLARPLQHLQVAVGVAERGNRPATDMLLDADGLAGLVVDEIGLRQLNENRLSPPDLELQFAAAADHLFRGDAIHLFAEDAHEADSAAGDNKGLESISAEISEQFEHRLINHFTVQFSGSRMLCRGNPFMDGACEFLGSHTRVGRRHDLQNSRLAAGERRFEIALEERDEGFLVLPFGVLRRQR